MAETLINTNQNQLNNQNGSYVELIKNTQQAKVNLTTALVNKGADVSSSSTFTDLVNATNNLTVNNSPTMEVGNVYSSVSTSYYANHNTNSIIINNNKGRFMVATNTENTVTFFNITPSLYNNVNTDSDINVTGNRKSFTITAKSSPSNWIRKFYMNEDGSKLWAFTNTNTNSIAEYVVDYSGVTDSVPAANITVTLNKTYTIATTLSQGRGVIAVNEEKKKMLISSTTGSSYNFTNSLYMVDYSEGDTDLVATSISNTLSNGANSSPICTLTKDVFYYGNANETGTVYFVKIDWDNDEVDLMKTYDNVYNYNSYEEISHAITINNKPAVCFTQLYYNSVYKQRLVILFLDDFTEITSDYIDIYSIPATAPIGSQAKYMNSCNEYFDGDYLYLCGGSDGVYYKVNLQNMNIETYNCLNIIDIAITSVTNPRRTPITSSKSIFLPQTNNMLFFRIEGYVYKNTISSGYLLGFRYNNVTYIPAGYSNSKIKLPEPEVLVEDN